MMRFAAVLLGTCAVCLVFAVTSTGRRQDTPESSLACAMVRQALVDSQEVKPEMKREDVEKNFREDGGLQFPAKGRYTYRSCRYMKLEVEYDPVSNQAFSADDKVRSISKLYIDYPTMD